MRPLLTLVDFQTAFLSAPGMEPSSASVIERACFLLQACRELRIPVVHVRTGSARGTRIPRLKKGCGSKPQIDSAEYQPPEGLSANPDECVIHKFGYSGVRDDAVSEIIQRNNIDTLFVAGVYTHACVRQTALDGLQAGLEVVVVDDAVASDDPIHAEITRRFLEERSVRFMHAVDLVSWPVPRQTRRADKVGPVVSSAKCFAATWKSSKWTARIGLIESLHDQIQHASAKLAKEITTGIGKPILFSEAEVRSTCEMLRAIIGRFGAIDEPANHEPSGASVRRFPHGVVAVVTPFNNPVYLPAGKIVPAMLFGNSVVWKPAPQALGAAQMLVSLLRESHWPVGLVNLLEGDASVGRELLNHELVDAITITGSAAAGRSASLAAAGRGIPLQAELGGNNAAIVWDDADLQEAAKRLCAGAFESAGQRCTANRRVIVHQNIRAKFLSLLQEETRALNCGRPEDRDSRVGLLGSKRQRDSVAAAVDRARKVCECLVPQEDSVPDSHHADRWYLPTIVCCDDPQHEIVQEETFGPVLVVQTAQTWEEAIELCNGVRQGLAAAIFSASSETIGRFLSNAQAGILKVNQSTAGAAVDVPFGGWKASGIGPPEHGAFDLEFFTRPQTVYRSHDETY